VENIQSPGGQSDHNSTSYGSLQKPSTLHEVLNDQCQYAGTDTSGFGEFVLPPLPSSQHNHSASTAQYEEHFSDGFYAPLRRDMSDAGHIRGNMHMQMGSFPHVEGSSSREPWHLTNAFTNMTIGSEKKSAHYTARNVKPIGSKERSAESKSGLGLDWMQSNNDIVQRGNLLTSAPDRSGELLWSDDTSRSQWSHGNVCSMPWQIQEKAVMRENHSMDNTRRHMMETLNVETGRMPHQRHLDSPDATAANARMRYGETSHQQDKLLGSHLPMIVAEELARIPVHMRQQYVDALLATHLASSSALMGPAAQHFIPGTMWQHPSVYRYMVSPFAGSHVINRKVPVMVGGQSVGPLPYDLPATAPFAIPVPAFKAFRFVFTVCPALIIMLLSALMNLKLSLKFIDCAFMFLVHRIVISFINFSCSFFMMFVPLRYLKIHNSFPSIVLKYIQIINLQNIMFKDQVFQHLLNRIQK